MRGALLALALWAAGSGSALADPKLQLTQSQIVFVSHQMGVPVEGQFGRFDAQFEFDPRKPQAGRISLKVDLASAMMPTDEASAELAKPDWFDVRRFPQASFESNAVRALGAGRFEATGRLTIKGRTMDVVAPFALEQHGPVTTASGSFAIRRLAFGIGGGDWGDTSLVDDQVQIKFRLALTGVAAL